LSSANAEQSPALSPFPHPFTNPMGKNEIIIIPKAKNKILMGFKLIFVNIITSK
jgi:hypothetical protein